MKIVFFSDAHGNQYTVRKMVEKLEILEPDLVIFGGDIFGYYYGQKEIINLLRDCNCKCLLGNHDQYFLDLVEGKRELEVLRERYGNTYSECLHSITEDEIRFIKEMKYRFDLKVDGLHLVFVHGSLLDPLEGRVYPDTRIMDYSPYEGVDYVFYGHTHHKLVKRLDNGTVLINPGSIGQQRDGKGCTYVIFETDIKKHIFEEIKYDIEKLMGEIRTHSEKPETEEKLIEVLYRDNRIII